MYWGIDTMFEEFRALKNVKDYFHGYKIEINPSRCTATVLISKLEIWIDPIELPGDWVAVDLRNGVISTVYESHLSKDERQEIRNIAQRLEEFYKLELSKLPKPLNPLSQNISFLLNH